MRCLRMFADNANRLNQLNMLYARYRLAGQPDAADRQAGRRGFSFRPASASDCQRHRLNAAAAAH